VLGRLGEVVDLKTQLILLTATLPPRYERDLLRTLSLESSETKIFRNSTIRTNIQYIVREKVSKEEVFSIIRKKDDEFPLERIVIYTRTIEAAKELNRELNYSIYYSNSPRKERVLSDFLEGKIRILISTSSLSYGIDVPNIRVVFHLGLPYRLYDYAQETGRAGRDGKDSEAILLLSNSINSSTLSTQLGPRPSKVEVFENSVIQRYISNTCRRAIFSSYLDGKEIEKCEKPAIPCDFCLKYYESKSFFFIFILF